MDQDDKANTLVATATASAIGAALIPVPIADAVMITGVQVVMLVSISSVYGKPISKDTAKGLLLSYGAAQAGMWMASTLKAIPGVGTGAGMAISASIAGTFTAALGVAFKAMARSNRPISKEELGRIRKDPAVKAEAKRIAAEYKAKQKRTEQVKKIIAFAAEPAKFIDRVSFSFNLEVTGAPAKLRVTTLNGEDVVYEKALASGSSSYVWNSPSSLSKGVYLAYLDIDGLIPIGIRLEKV